MADWADEDDELLNGRGGRGASGDHGAEDAAAPGGSLIKPKATSQTTAATSTISASPLPSPFDDTPSSAFQSPGASDACPRFMSSLLANESFKSCYPLSMMLQVRAPPSPALFLSSYHFVQRRRLGGLTWLFSKTSNSFFDAEKQLLSIVRVLDATCSVQSSYCTALLDEAARNLTQSGNCKTEYDAKQQLVLEAFTGLRAYQMMFAATCLQDPSSDMYCFASAVTNVTDPTDFNFYFMPYGYALPGGSSPTCDWCTQQTMAVFHAASADRTQAVSKVYVAAAQQVNALCGSNFVNATLPAASSRASASTMSTTSRILAVSCVVAWAAALW